MDQPIVLLVAQVHMTHVSTENQKSNLSVDEGLLWTWSLETYFHQKAVSRVIFNASVRTDPPEAEPVASHRV